jgi:hypothetical protein
LEAVPEFGQQLVREVAECGTVIDQDKRRLRDCGLAVVEDLCGGSVVAGIGGESGLDGREPRADRRCVPGMSLSYG